MMAGHFLLIFKTEAGSESALGTCPYTSPFSAWRHHLLIVHIWLAKSFILHSHFLFNFLISLRHIRPRGFPIALPLTAPSLGHAMC